MRFTRELWRIPSAAGLGLAAVSALPVAAHNRYAALFAVIYGAAAIGLARRSVVTQVLGQGAALALVLAQAGLLLQQRPSALGLSLLGEGLVALLAGLPFWAAQDRFAPLLGRRAFLVGSLASVAVAVRLTFLSMVTAGGGLWYYGALFVLVALMLVAQATAVVRMRGWGVLMATATGAGCVIPAFVLHGSASWLTAFAAVASAALVAPVASALAGKAVPARTRIELPVRERIEIAPAHAVDDEMLAVENSDRRMTAG